MRSRASPLVVREHAYVRDPDAQVLGILLFVCVCVSAVFTLTYTLGSGMPTHTTFVACAPVAIVASAASMLTAYKLEKHPPIFVAVHVVSGFIFVVLFLFSLRYD